MDECKPLVLGHELERTDPVRARGAAVAHLRDLRGGRVVHVEPMKPTLMAPGIKRLKPKYDGLLSSSAFKFNLRRYTEAAKLAEKFPESTLENYHLGRTVQIPPYQTHHPIEPTLKAP